MFTFIFSLISRTFIVHVSVTIHEALNVSDEPGNEDQEEAFLVSGDVIAEWSGYFFLLAAVFLLDRKKFQAAMEASTMAISMFQASQDQSNTFDPLLARHYYFLSLCYEVSGQFPHLHNFLMLGLRTAALNHNKETQAVIYNSILRLHLLQKDFDSAATFLKNSPFPSASANLNNQTARFHFYRARIAATHTANYSEASEELSQALRKAPHGHFALNFILAATKFAIVVQLLCGEIPDHSTFNLHPRALKPYLELTQSVRLGELAPFQQILNRHSQIWAQDETQILVERLHESVLRVGLRRLCKSYCRINFADIATKLGLPSESDAKSLVQTAIAAGVISSAQINESLACLESHQSTDLYTTRAPQEALSSRTQVLQNFHREAVKAMRFPEKSSAKSSSLNEDRRPTEEELMDEFMDADDEMF